MKWTKVDIVLVKQADLGSVRWFLGRHFHSLAQRAARMSVASAPNSDAEREPALPVIPRRPPASRNRRPRSCGSTLKRRRVVFHEVCFPDVCRNRKTCTYGISILDKCYHKISWYLIIFRKVMYNVLSTYSVAMDSQVCAYYLIYILLLGILQQEKCSKNSNSKINHKTISIVLGLDLLNKTVTAAK